MDDRLWYKANSCNTNSTAERRNSTFIPLVLCFHGFWLTVLHYLSSTLQFMFPLLLSLSFVPLFFSVSIPLFPSAVPVSLFLPSSTLLFFFPFAHFVLLSSHPPWFSCQDKDVVLHALSICFMPSTSNLFRLRNKSISVNILRSWIGAIKCFFCRACLGSDPQCWFEYSIKWDFNKCR